MNELSDGGDYIAAALSLFHANSAGATCAALAREHNMAAYKVRHLVRIARKLHSETLELCQRNQRLSYGHARVLASIDMPQQVDAARTTVAKHWSVRQLERYTRNEPESSDSSYYERLSESLSEQMGRPLAITPDKATPTAGSINIRYFDLDDFDTICSRIGVDLSEC